MLLYKITVGLAVVVALTGCNTTIVKPLKEQEAATYVPGENPGNGFVVGSFVVHGNPPEKMAKGMVKLLTGGDSNANFEYGAYTLMFRERPAAADATPIEGNFSFDRRSAFKGEVNTDFEIDDGRGHVLVVPVPEGNYEFYQHQIYHGMGTGESTWSAREDFSVPFRVRPGKAVYIGEVRVKHLFDRNFLGTPIPAGGIFECRDEHDRDLPLIRAQYPFIEDLEVARETICNDLNALRVETP